MGCRYIVLKGYADYLHTINGTISKYMVTKMKRVRALFTLFSKCQIRVLIGDGHCRYNSEAFRNGLWVCSTRGRSAVRLGRQNRCKPQPTSSQERFVQLFSFNKYWPEGHCH